MIGGVVFLGILGYMLWAGIWSLRSYEFRARKKLIEDQVYSIVIGAQSQDIFAPSSVAEDDGAQVRIMAQPASYSQTERDPA